MYRYLCRSSQKSDQKYGLRILIPICIHVSDISRVKPAFTGKGGAVEGGMKIRRYLVALESGNSTNAHSACCPDLKLLFEIARVTDG
jgi:hypothetical protein